MSLGDEVAVLAVGGALWHSCHLLRFCLCRLGERSCERRVIVEGSGVFLLVWGYPWFAVWGREEYACCVGDVREGGGVLLHGGRFPSACFCGS
ncbi:MULTISPECIES: hypothetical protein [unclassified Bartonella]|uniref:hypothetical protein n=1 Tax=unclassified Bartonella TaxID=2645622 RepID=UPI0023625F6D|nr:MULTISPECIES: hypothetical protein [unclassified Bartonella]